MQTGVLWRKLHEHVNYMQNPRYAADIKQFKVAIPLPLFQSKATKLFNLSDE